MEAEEQVEEVLEQVEVDFHPDSLQHQVVHLDQFLVQEVEAEDLGD